MLGTDGRSHDWDPVSGGKLRFFRGIIGSVDIILQIVGIVQILLLLKL